MLVAAASKRMSPSSAPAAVVLIRSSAYSSLPSPGNRVGTGDASNMPTIQATTGNNAILTADGAHHYRLVGLQIKAPTTLLQGSIVKIGGGETTLAEFPTDITIDRCLIRGDATVGARRGVQLDGIRCAVVDSYIYDCKENGADSQAVWAYNTPGPLKIVNNYLEAAGENLMFGGADPSYTNSLPRDVEIRRNYFFKPLGWIGSVWDVKNLLEFKLGERILVEGNVLQNCWPESQSGFAFLITPRNETGPTTWAVTQDITFRFNKILNSKSGMNISGKDGNPVVSQETYRITVNDNLIQTDVTASGGLQRLFQLLSGPDYVELINNTFVDISATGAAGYLAPAGGDTGSNLTVRNNIFTQREYGILGDGDGTGTSAFNTFFTSWSYTYNMLIGGASGSYPGASGNLFPADTTAAKFTNYAGGDYSLASDSPGHNAGSDSTDMGADFTALASYTANTVDGQWGSEPATYTDRTYTNAELPRSYVDTRYAAQTGTTWNCTTAAEFTTALAGCAVGDTIVLTAGNTFTGSFTLRNI